MQESNAYRLPDANYIKHNTFKERIVLANTRNVDMRHFVGWVKRYNGKYTATAQYTIRKDGTVCEHFDPDYTSNFFHSVELDNPSIIILLENQGYLLKNKDSYVDWLGNIYSDTDNIFLKAWRNHSIWDSYTEKQLLATKELVEKLCRRYNINKSVPESNTYLGNDVKKYGIIYRTNIDRMCWDLNPSWDYEWFKTIIEI